MVTLAEARAVDTEPVCEGLEDACVETEAFVLSKLRTATLLTGFALTDGGFVVGWTCMLVVTVFATRGGSGNDSSVKFSIAS